MSSQLSGKPFISGGIGLALGIGIMFLVNSLSRPDRTLGEGQFIPVTITQEEEETPGGGGSANGGGIQIRRKPVKPTFKEDRLKISATGEYILKTKRKLNINKIKVRVVEVKSSDVDDITGSVKLNNNESGNFSINIIDEQTISIKHDNGTTGLHYIILDGLDMNGKNILFHAPIYF
ncbi:hypothetical protein [Armatimonas sp.]|uniref:hypothetical protein n=1 Tax=Armatimonas sp. TaxID=1872638 RepID=UPI00286A1FA4|nr:hypothetical protein [Armatimonas sp.]